MLGSYDSEIGRLLASNTKYRGLLGKAEATTKIGLHGKGRVFLQTTKPKRKR
jgi:hypothetical protein